MKKLLCMILALVMVLSLCACGEGPADNGSVNGNDTTGNDSTGQMTEDETQGTTAPAVPTSEEMETLKEYVKVVASLNEMAASLEEHPDSTGGTEKKRDALLALDLDTVSLWADTQWAESAYKKCDEPESFSYPADFNCEAVLARFVKVEDVKLSYTVTDTDFLGNVDGPRETAQWDYYADGKVRTIEDEFDTYRINIEYVGMQNTVYEFHKYSNYREYDADGKLNKISYCSSGSVVVVRIFTYDAEGKLTTQTVKTNSSELIYNYFHDAAGRLVKINEQHEGSLGHTYTREVLYTYDANGNLIKEEYTSYDAGKDGVQYITYRYSMEYVYDASGKLASGAYTKQEWSDSKAKGNYLFKQAVDQYTFVLDDQGRVVKEIVVPGDTINMQSNTVSRSADKAQIVYETVYGDYYVYTPAN